MFYLYPNVSWLIDGREFSMQRYNERILITLSYPWLDISELFYSCDCMFFIIL